MICGVEDQQEYVMGARYRVRARWVTNRKQVEYEKQERDYIYMGATRGCGVIHYVFRSCSGGWLESFSDLLILLGEIDIRPCRRGGRSCNV